MEKGSWLYMPSVQITKLSTACCSEGHLISFVSGLYTYLFPRSEGGGVYMFMHMAKVLLLMTKRESNNVTTLLCIKITTNSVDYAGDVAHNMI